MEVKKSFKPEAFNQPIVFGPARINRERATNLVRDFFGDKVQQLPDFRINDSSNLIMTCSPDGITISSKLPQRIAINFLINFQDKIGYTLPLNIGLVQEFVALKKNNLKSRDPSVRASRHVRKLMNLEYPDQVVEQPLLKRYFEAITKRLVSMNDADKEIFIKRQLKAYMNIVEFSMMNSLTGIFIHEYYHYLHATPLTKIDAISVLLGSIPVAVLTGYGIVENLPQPARALLAVASFLVGIGVIYVGHDKSMFNHEVEAYVKEGNFIESKKPPIVEIVSRKDLWGPCFNNKQFFESLNISH